MQGYFEYVLKGTKAELQEAQHKIEELAKTNSDFKTLLEFIDEEGIKSVTYCDDDITNCSLAYGMLGGSGNINGIGLDYDDMMYDLCKEFANLEIEGTGYLLDFPPYPEWHSPKNSDTYETIVRETLFAELDRSCYVIKNDANELEIICDTVVVDCPCCDQEIRIKSQDIIDRYKEDDCDDPDEMFMYYEAEVECDTCGTTLTLEIDFN